MVTKYTAKGKFDPVHVKNAYGVSGNIGSLILNLGTRWEWPASHPGCCSPVPIEEEIGWALE
jgi:hypothetical protein